MWIFPGLLNFPRPLERHARENSTKRGQRLVSSCLCTAHCLRNIYHRCIIQRGRIFTFEQSSIQSNFNEIEQPEFLQKYRRLWFFLLIDWIDNSGIASSILSHFVISYLFVYQKSRQSLDLNLPHYFFIFFLSLIICPRIKLLFQHLKFFRFQINVSCSIEIRLKFLASS